MSLTSIFFVILSIGTVQLYRLPELYTPSSYDINLSLPPEAFTNASNAYTGQVTVQFSFVNVSNSIALHAHHEFIQINRITFDGLEVPSGNYSVDNVTDILTIDLSDVVPTANLTTNLTYSLVIEFTGSLSTADMYGFYKSYYVDANGTTRYLATTQFEATHARRAFPCFDEPALKAAFDFSISVPNGLNVLFNTQQNSSVSNATTGLTTVVFDTSPVMPTYLFAAIVSDFTCTSGVSIGTVPYQVCSRNQSSATRQLAVEVGPQLLGSLNNFTNYDYSLGNSKMDQVAIPDFAAGAMENWGLVTYRETAILWDPSESSNRYRQRVVTVIAHEFAHQWFGNLVTMRWWSEIFLNEGFATYFEYHTSHEILPTWQLNKQFVLEEMHPALYVDSLETAHALQSNCTTPAEISSKFSTISYSKGGSVLRMVEHFLQLENFRTGLRNYLVTYQFDNTEPEDLWAILNQSVVDAVSRLPANLPTVMENWVTRSGYPVLTVTLDGNRVNISQKRFLLSGEERLEGWYVPISYTTSVDSDKFVNTTPRAWLTPTSNLTITLPTDSEWIILNNQQTGFYRVNYDTVLLSRIKDALYSSNFSGITELNRAHIIDDLFNLARAGLVSYSVVLDTVKFLASDTSYYSWNSAFSGFSYLLRRVGTSSTLGQMLRIDLLNLMTTLYNSVPVSNPRDDDIIYTHTQLLALSWACKLRSRLCVEEVETLFTQYQTSRVRPNRNLRSVVYCNALRYSANSSSDWNFLWNEYLNSGDLATEQNTILSSLGCITEPVILTEDNIIGISETIRDTKYLRKTITDGSGIRPQDTLAAFQSVYMGSPEGVDIAFDFLVQNYTTIAAKYAGWNSLGNLIKGLAETFTSESQISRLRNFTQSANLPEPFRVAANEALEVAETNARWLQANEGDLSNYYGIVTAGSETSMPSIIVLSAAVVLLFLRM